MECADIATNRYQRLMDGGKAIKENMADINLVVPGPNTARIQEVHEILYHTACLVLEKKLIEEKIISYRP